MTVKDRILPKYAALHHSNIATPMSDLGHARHFRHADPTSVDAPVSDIQPHLVADGFLLNVSFGAAANFGKIGRTLALRTVHRHRRK